MYYLIRAVLIYLHQVSTKKKKKTVIFLKRLIIIWFSPRGSIIVTGTFLLTGSIWITKTMTRYLYHAILLTFEMFFFSLYHRHTWGKLVVSDDAYGRFTTNTGTGYRLYVDLIISIAFDKLSTREKKKESPRGLKHRPHIVPIEYVTVVLYNTVTYPLWRLQTDMFVNVPRTT